MEEDIMLKINKARQLVIAAQNAGISVYSIERGAFGGIRNHIGRFVAGKHTFSEASLDKLINYLDGILEPKEKQEEEQDEDNVPKPEQNQSDHDDEVDKLNDEDVELRLGLDAIARIKGTSTTALHREIVREYLKKVARVLEDSGL